MPARLRLTALAQRIEKIRQQPAIRELERIDTFYSAVSADFYARYPQHADFPAWLAYGFMAEEFRLSVFAPTLAAKGRASAKKLAAAAELLWTRPTRALIRSIFFGHQTKRTLCPTINTPRPRSQAYGRGACNEYRQ